MGPYQDHLMTHQAIGIFGCPPDAANQSVDIGTAHGQGMVDGN
jgi:hypothetical protein